jgi:hypothetical protein
MNARRSSLWREVAEDLFALACMLAAFGALTLLGFAVTGPPA